MEKFWGMVFTVVLVAAGCSDSGDDASSAAPAVESTTTSTTTTTTTTTTAPPVDAPVSFDTYDWSLVADEAPWGGRAGLRIVEKDGSLFVLGGRTPKQSTVPGDSVIHGDIWRSDDTGVTWTQILATDSGAWPARAYFSAVTIGDEMVVLGGQDFGLETNPFCALLEQGFEPPPGLGIDLDAPCPEFVPTSNFFSDVWASSDGVTWEERTAEAGWAGRAGLSAVVAGDAIYVMGGSQNDDSAVIGANGPERLYFNDVWRSTDGVEWELLTDAAPWEPRAGASVVERDGEIWLFGGEDGFTCSPLPDCEAPYFNDVWHSADGVEWTEVSESAGWSPRPGHQCEVVEAEFVCFGGFGLIENPTDVWSSLDGASWTLLEGAPWNATDPEFVRYDFDSIAVVRDGVEMILTVGGDRETFDFGDPENYLRIEDDTWMFAPAR
ncbi:MAG: hypothetical protein ACI9C1_004042 [Candidatus Aldehydirespiratoraceae bacterium]|jgi:hypothetical protein